MVSQRFVNFQKWYSKRSDDFDIPLLAEEVISNCKNSIYTNTLDVCLFGCMHEHTGDMSRQDTNIFDFAEC